VLDRFERKEADQLPALSPLSEIVIRTNQEIIQQFGLDEGDPGQDAIAGAL
jgi:hypothetical protein